MSHTIYGGTTVNRRYISDMVCDWDDQVIPLEGNPDYFIRVGVHIWNTAKESQTDFDNHDYGFALFNIFDRFQPLYATRIRTKKLFEGDEWNSHLTKEAIAEIDRFQIRCLSYWGKIEAYAKKKIVDLT